MQLRARSRPLGATSPAGRLALVAAASTVGVLLAAAPATADGSRADVNRYLADVADAAAKPGVYVDPAVLEEGKLTSKQVSGLDRKAADVAGPVRVMVLPVAKLTVDRGGKTSADLAYRPERLVKELYRRVDRPGTYAVLVSAPTQGEGQSFYAFQWPRGGPEYDIEDAATKAIACCAPDYAPMLRRFLKEADDPLEPGGDGSASGGGPIVTGTDDTGTTSQDSGGPRPWLLVLGGLLAAAVGIAVLLARRRLATMTSGLDADTDASLRTAFTEEIGELRQRVDGIGPAVTGDRDAADGHAESLRKLMDQAPARLAAMRGSADAQAVARTLADARFELAAAKAVREQRPVPARTPPCFVDPRHGLSAVTMVYPSSGLSSPVPVCAGCQAELEAGQEPRPRMLGYRGSWANHWLAGTPAWVYLHGYWAGQPFMHQHFSLPPAGWTTPADTQPVGAGRAADVPPPGPVA